MMPCAGASINVIFLCRVLVDLRKGFCLLLIRGFRRGRTARGCAGHLPCEAVRLTFRRLALQVRVILLNIRINRLRMTPDR